MNYDPEPLWKLLFNSLIKPLLYAIGLFGAYAGVIAFDNSGIIDFIQSLPLFRLDKTDAC